MHEGGIFDAVQLIKEPSMIQIMSNLVLHIYIATSLCWVLWSAKSETLTTQTVISRLILYASTRGILLIATQVLELALFIKDIEAVGPSLLVDFAYFPTSSVYVNTLLATLNARNSVNNIGAPRTQGILSTFSARAGVLSQTDSLDPGRSESLSASRLLKPDV